MAEPSVEDADHEAAMTVPPDEEVATASSEFQYILSDTEVRLVRLALCQTTALTDALSASTTLTKLWLYGPSIGDAGAAAVARALEKNATVRQLSFFKCRIGEVGAASLARALKVNSTLTTFILSANCIGADGAVSLGQALQTNASLESLQLDSNGIGDCGAVAIANCLKVNRSLNIVGLQWNDIGDEGVHAFLDVIETRMRKTPFHPVRIRLGRFSWESCSLALHCALKEATEKWENIRPTVTLRANRVHALVRAHTRLTTVPSDTTFWSYLHHQPGVSWSGSSIALRNKRRHS
jgi:Leucine Rich repeat